MKCVSTASVMTRAIVAAIGLGFATPSSMGLVITVPTQQHPTIQAGINAAQNGDIVLVSDGTYSGQGNYNITFSGKAITVQSVNGAASTVIDIQGTPQTQRTGFIFQNNESPASVLTGFTIKHGYQFNGGAMVLFASSPTIRDCIMTENHSDCWGAAVYYDGNACPLIEGCKFANNTSGDDGGAIFGLGGSPVIRNCQITNNDGGITGGAMTTFGTGSPKLINSTVVGNNAIWGAAIYSNNLEVINSIIWGNTGKEQIYSFSETVVVKYSIIEGGYDGTGNLHSLPQFADAESGDYHLVRGSPGVDAGDPEFQADPGSVDVDGDPRVFGSAVDMGIDEYRKAGDVNGDHVVNTIDLLGVINAWGPCTVNPADFNGDFSVGVSDLLFVISNWG